VHALLQREQAFVGDVSHELRTPVAVIRGAAELLARRELDPAARAQVARIREAARSAEELIELLLALAREETAHEPRIAIALLPLVEKLLVRHTELLGNPDVEVEIDVAPQLRVLAPPVATEVVLSNLITNALRHGGGTIAIAATEASITVSNSGPGRNEDGGRGIGLDLVRRLCDVSGFTLTFASSENGTNATVAFAGSAGSGRSFARPTAHTIRPNPRRDE
jgi:signal transduction histidine kinase